ncbi:hypothetical protein HMN09_01397700 [Mycena chlorophos]|uniref:Uncharacterized protein n=1 Tax=Mycena chlorophos TaxID=658473 RepID=A0A8H6RX83_MYCCL|nr:hypothetical protein HMN09_01397700 [Mycena chlorophos]
MFLHDPPIHIARPVPRPRTPVAGAEAVTAIGRGPYEARQGCWDDSLLAVYPLLARCNRAALGLVHSVVKRRRGAVRVVRDMPPYDTTYGFGTVLCSRLLRMWVATRRFVGSGASRPRHLLSSSYTTSPTRTSSRSALHVVVITVTVVNALPTTAPNVIGAVSCVTSRVEGWEAITQNG